MAVYVHPTARVSNLADIELSCRGSSLYIGENTKIDSFVKIIFCGGIGDIYIGDHVFVNSGSVIYSGNGVKIGNKVAIAANCCIAPVNHEYKNANKIIFDQGFMPSRGGVIIEDDVWVGAGSALLDGSILKIGCVIGAMSLVKGEVEQYSVNAGNPLRCLGFRK